MKKPILLIVITLILIYTAFLTIKPLLTAILSSFILAFVFYPVYLKLNTKISNKNLCSLLTIILILLLIIVPTVLITNALAKESLTFYHKVKEKDFSLIISKYFESNFQQYIGSIVNESILYIIKLTSNFVLSIPNIALRFFVTIFLTYYLLKESQAFIEAAKRYLPFKESVKGEILERFSRVTKAIVLGTILTAIIQGILGGIGFAIFNIRSVDSRNRRQPYQAKTGWEKSKNTSSSYPHRHPRGNKIIRIHRINNRPLNSCNRYRVD